MKTPMPQTGGATLPLPPEMNLAEHAPSSTMAFDTGKAVRYSVANFGAQAVFTLLTTGMSFYLASYAELRSQPELIGLLSNERALVAAAAQPIVGRLSDRTRTPLGKRRPFFLVGIPLMSAALMALSTHPPFWVMLGIMSIAAFFLWVAMDPYVALLADLFPPQQRGRVGGILGLSQMLGSIVFLLFAINFWDKSEGLVFAVTITVLVVAFGFTFLTVKEPPLTEHKVTEKKPKMSPRAYIRSVLTYREAAKYTLALVFFWIGNGGATPYLVLFGEKALRLTQGQSFYLPLAFVIATALLSVPAGFMADRIGKKPVITVGLLMFGVSALVGSQSGNITHALFALFAIGMGNAGIGTVLNPLLADLIPRSRTGELIGLSSAVTSFAQPLGSVLAGLVVKFATGLVGENDAYRWSFIFAGICVVIAAVLMQTVHPKRAMFDEQVA